MNKSIDWRNRSNNLFSFLSYMQLLSVVLVAATAWFCVGGVAAVPPPSRSDVAIPSDVAVESTTIPSHTGIRPYRGIFNLPSHPLDIKVATFYNHALDTTVGADVVLYAYMSTRYLRLLFDRMLNLCQTAIGAHTLGASMPRRTLLADFGTPVRLLRAANVAVCVFKSVEWARVKRSHNLLTRLSTLLSADLARRHGQVWMDRLDGGRYELSDACQFGNVIRSMVDAKLIQKRTRRNVDAFDRHVQGIVAELERQSTHRVLIKRLMACDDDWVTLLRDALHTNNASVATGSLDGGIQ
jgi:hypothetical protein